jgi:ribosome-associated protein
MKTKQKSTIDTKSKLENFCVWLVEKKANEPVALELSPLRIKQGKSLIAEGIIVAGANSVRHGQGLADFLLDQAKANNYEFFRMEGYNNGLWILLDFNDVIVNILKTEQREMYRLEDLYPGATVIHDDRVQPTIKNT